MTSKAIPLPLPAAFMFVLAGCGGNTVQLPTYTPYPTYTSVPPTATPNDRDLQRITDQIQISSENYVDLRVEPTQHLFCKQGVRGSNPLSSTNLDFPTPKPRSVL